MKSQSDQSKSSTNNKKNDVVQNIVKDTTGSKMVKDGENMVKDLVGPNIVKDGENIVKDLVGSNIAKDIFGKPKNVTKKSDQKDFSKNQKDSDNDLKGISNFFPFGSSEMNYFTKNMQSILKYIPIISVSVFFIFILGCCSCCFICGMLCIRRPDSEERESIYRPSSNNYPFSNIALNPR